MKKAKFLMGVIGVTLLMTSCLGEGSNNYTESAAVYIAESPNFSTYGRTHTGRFITSNSMQLMMPGSIHYFTYSWDEEYGYEQLGDNIVADKVVISGDPVEISVKDLRTIPAPEVEDPDKFNQVSAPFYAYDKTYFGDNWLFEYDYEAKTGEVPNVEFYIREVSDEDADVTIDIRLVITGEPESTSASQKRNITAVNMSPVRSVETATANEIKIKFYYPLKNNTDLKASQVYKLTVTE